MNDGLRSLLVLALLLGCGDDVASGGGDDDGSETGAPRPPEDAFVAGPTGGAGGTPVAVDGPGERLAGPAAAPGSSGLGFNYYGIAVYGDSVYVTDATGPDGHLLRIPKTGGAPVVLGERLMVPTTVRAEADGVYVLTTTDLFRFPPDGGDRSRLADVENAQYAGLALDATHAYFANYAEAGSVARVEKSGEGEVEILATDEPYPAGVVVAGDAVYYAVLGADRVRRVPKDGGAVADVATEHRTPRLGLATSETHLFWVTEGDAPMRLWRAPLAGGPAELVGESPSTASWAVTLVVDATHVYFPTPDCQIVRLPHASGAPRALNVLAFSPAAGCPGQIAGDATHLYYTSMTGVFRVAKTAF
ncbi:hypothetical protein L6V77_22410 [Myxococcota bacterium]|nr:hypothetical protein [Myxococcota bacterium]